MWEYQVQKVKTGGLNTPNLDSVTSATLTMTAKQGWRLVQVVPLPKTGGTIEQVYFYFERESKPKSTKPANMALRISRKNRIAIANNPPIATDPSKRQLYDSRGWVLQVQSAWLQLVPYSGNYDTKEKFASRAATALNVVSLEETSSPTVEELIDGSPQLLALTWIVEGDWVRHID